MFEGIYLFIGSYNRTMISDTPVICHLYDKRRENIKVLEWPGPDLNPNKMLLWDLKHLRLCIKKCHQTSMSCECCKKKKEGAKIDGRDITS